ncbi:similar to Saccharomyces cerevisiae YMR041C ARA2 NAD-dependent arabinose dehydrogenase, involved in biosynthesis of dehydro-D-arabinono-1,4-lactone [Maudiozyma saulgeensis]|uniref:Similar to Saccharomyces cerevisiae YMR041C ARA2 NAD-dependent arabinose dehydrogenase, involved in biosynthesis of dehydro-D-arabinono-1,4-lactone n=1 Tax=Maudiozyma saulgeensis TaxID=1789683 RepID=A0A1X7R813_9SACH|nr:similar to Saccharomyces cerevisiae YMR041C ARA2 NAD-dependent arabinose dehydrogenase, involved in biosynthesis of dehydro-D-arabinono-1,4-lactone [Kazachstania saulgeensis]
MSSKRDFHNVSNLVLGCGTFNHQYNDDPTEVPVKQLLELAMKSGVNTIDTSPYYGPSELLIGQALSQMSWKRSELTICTKVGRVEEDVFDYTAKGVRASVMRSLKRLLGGSFTSEDNKSWYLDIVYLHDVEFQTVEQGLTALRELRVLQKEGYIHHIGISGYPLDYLYKLALLCVKDSNIGPLDCMLSYCNLNLQNIDLLNYYDLLKEECQIGQIANASVLSMSLLREQETRYFHPASPELQEAVKSAATYCNQKDMTLADLAVKYALVQWNLRGPTVIGFSNVAEFQEAFKIYTTLSQDGYTLTESEQQAVSHIQHEILGTHFNEKWSSGITHPDS